jgi:hypothetical protein
MVFAKPQMIHSAWGSYMVISGLQLKTQAVYHSTYI